MTYNVSSGTLRLYTTYAQVYRICCEFAQSRDPSDITKRAFSVLLCWRS